MNRKLKVILSIVVLAIILGIIQVVFNIDDATFWRGYRNFGIVAILGSALVNLIYFLYYDKKMKDINYLLNKDGAEEYIAKTQAMLEKAKGSALRNTLNLNLSAGLFYAERYDEAKEVLEELSKVKLDGKAVKLVHGVNLCLTYFKLKEYDKARDLYNSKKKLFNKYEENKGIGPFIAEINTLIAIDDGDYELADSLLNDALETWKEERFQDGFKEIKKRLDGLLMGNE